MEEFVTGLHCHSQGGDWVDDAVVAVFFVGVDVDVGSFSKLGHVGKEEDVFLVEFQFCGHHLELKSCVEALLENHIINIGFGSFDALEPNYSLGVGS